MGEVGVGRGRDHDRHGCYFHLRRPSGPAGRRPHERRARAGPRVRARRDQPRTARRVVRWLHRLGLSPNRFCERAYSMERGVSWAPRSGRPRGSEAAATLRTRAPDTTWRTLFRTTAASYRCSCRGSRIYISGWREAVIPAPTLWPLCGHVGRCRSSRDVVGHDEPELNSLTWQRDAGTAGSGWEGSRGTQTPFGG